MASKVYYMNDRATHGGESVPFKAVKLLRDAGLKDMVKPGATVGIKIHTGNYGNSATHFLNHPEFGLHSGVVNQEVAQQMMQAPHPNFIDGIINNCAFDCFAVEDGEFVFHREKCKDCSACYYPTLFSGLMQFSNTLMTTTPTCIADSCAGIMNKLGKEKFIFVNYAYDITPSCDCDNKHDAAVIPNIGTFVSKDPVAVDMACLEACEAASVNPGSAFDAPGLAEPNSDRFTHGSSLAQVSQWCQINSGVFNGIGESEYELVESEPLSEAEVSSWIQDYDFTNPIGKRYRDQIRAFHFDTEGPTAVSEPRLPLEDQIKRPAGLVKNSKISDEQ